MNRAIVTLVLAGFAGSLIAQSPAEEDRQRRLQLDRAGGSPAHVVPGPTPRSYPRGPASLECDGPVVDFAGGIPVDWTIVNNAGMNPVEWSNIAGCGEAGNYATGTDDAACASSDLQGGGAAQYDTELWTNSVTLPGGGADLTYTVNYQNFALVDFLEVDVSTDGGTNWVNVLSWNEDHGSFRATPGELVVINLDAFVSQTIIIRWHYFDPGTGTGQDWYAQVDEVSLTCTIPVELTGFSVE